MHSLQDILQAFDANSPLDMDEHDLASVLFAHGDCPFDNFWGFANIVDNAHILDAPLAEGWSTGSPVYALGSGPSLTQYIPFLLSNTENIVTVAGASTAEMLWQHGLAVDFITPTERVVQHLDVAPSSVVASYPWVPSYSGERACYMPRCSMSEWAGHQCDIGQTLLSGMAAIGLASLIARGPVVVIGNDLCEMDGSGHAAGYRHTEYSRGELEVDCYDGVKRPSTRIWRRAIEWANRHGFTATTPVREAAILDGVLYSPLLPVGKCGKHLTHDGSRGPGSERVNALWSQLPEDIASLRDTCAVNDGENALLLNYVMQPLWAAFSIESRLCRSADVMAWFESSVRDVCNTLLATIPEVRHAA